MSRIKRDLYGNSNGALGQGLNKSSSTMLSRTLAKGRMPRICVVGAGFAGMRCANVLLQRGVNVTIVEARNRLGGRVAQSNHLGHLVDLGPNWIHGTDNNPIMDLATETGTVTHSWGERQAVFDEQGHMIPEDEAADYAEVMWGTISDAFKYSNDKSPSIPPSRSLMDFIEAEMKEKYPDGSVKRDLRKREAVLRIAEMWGAFVGTEIQRQSLRFFWLEESIEGKNLFVAGTYEKILQRVCASVSKADVKLQHKVVAIESNVSDKGSSKVLLKTENGWQDMFDEVVVTVPLGCLKRNKEIFQPPIPPRLSKAIDSIGYGRLDKVLITFPSAFWNESPTTEVDFSDRPMLAHRTAPNTTATTAPLHHPSDETSPSSNQYPGFTHYMKHTYAPNTNPHGWNIEGCNLASLPPSCAHPTILFYIFDPCSSHIAKLIASSPSPSHTTELLTAFFKPYFSRLPNYSEKTPACRPKSVLATAWANDEFAGYGSYSNFQTGLEEGDRDIEVMREGMPERGVWLAGEHTSPFVALGTTTGAWWSGERVARRISEAYGLSGDEVNRS